MVTSASNMIYRLRHMDNNIDPLELIDVYEVIKSSMSIIKEYAKEHDINYIVNDK